MIFFYLFIQLTSYSIKWVWIRCFFISLLNMIIGWEKKNIVCVRKMFNLLIDQFLRQMFHLFTFNAYTIAFRHTLVFVSQIRKITNCPYNQPIGRPNIYLKHSKVVIWFIFLFKDGKNKNCGQFSAGITLLDMSLYFKM